MWSIIFQLNSYFKLHKSSQLGVWLTLAYWEIHQLPLWILLAYFFYLILGQLFCDFINLFVHAIKACCIFRGLKCLTHWYNTTRVKQKPSLSLSRLFDWVDLLLLLLILSTVAAATFISRFILQFRRHCSFQNLIISLNFVT